MAKSKVVTAMDNTIYNLLERVDKAKKNKNKRRNELQGMFPKIVTKENIDKAFFHKAKSEIGLFTDIQIELVELNNDRMAVKATW